MLCIITSFQNIAISNEAVLLNKKIKVYQFLKFYLGNLDTVKHVSHHCKLKYIFTCTHLQCLHLDYDTKKCCNPEDSFCQF